MILTKNPSLNKAQSLSLLNNLLDQFQRWCNQTTEPSLLDIEKFFTRNFQLSSNGQTMTKSASEYLNRIIKIRRKYSNIDLTGPLEEPLISCNRLTLQYEITLKGRNGQKSLIYVMAIATIEADKFSHWNQVIHEKNLANWDA